MSQKSFFFQLNLLKPGGYLVLGSVIDDVIYNSGVSLVGDSKLFSLLDLSEEFIEEQFETNGMNMSTIHKYSLPNDGVAFFLIAKHIQNENLMGNDALLAEHIVEL